MGVSGLQADTRHPWRPVVSLTAFTLRSPHTVHYQTPLFYHTFGQMYDNTRRLISNSDKCISDFFFIGELFMMMMIMCVLPGKIYKKKKKNVGGKESGQI